MTLGTNNELYHSGLRFKVTLYDRKEENVIAVFDPFKNANPFILQNIGIDLSYFQVGSFGFTVNDTKQKIIKDLIDNEMVVLIEGGKTKDTMVPFISGFVEVRNLSSTKNNLVFGFSGLSKQAIWNYSQIEYQKFAQPKKIGELSPIFDRDMKIDHIIRHVFRSDDIFPIIDEKNLRERGNFSLDVLLGHVNEFAGSIDFKGSAGALFDNLANSAGAIILVDNLNRVRFVYPFSENTGLILKEFDKSEEIIDDPNRTAYIHSSFSMTESTSTNDGFFNGIIVDFNPEQIATSNAGEGLDFISMNGKDMCFQFVPRSTTLSNLAFVMAKKGTGRSNIEDSFDIKGVQGLIVTDDGSDNPSAGVVASFEIPYDNITSSPSIITGFPITRIAPSFDPMRKHWIIFTASGVDPANTVLIYTDGDADTVTDDSIIRLRRLGLKVPNSPKPNPQLRANFHKFFQISEKGPVPKHVFYTASSQELYYQDSLSISIYTPDRPKVTRVSAPFIKDHITAQKYASAIMEYAAKKKVVFDEMTVQIPNNPIFPLQTGYLRYAPFGYPKEQMLHFEVNGVRYSQNAASEPLGADYCSVQITAFLDHFLLDRIHPNPNCDGCIVC